MKEQKVGKDIKYYFPPINLLNGKIHKKTDVELLNKTALIIHQTLLRFGVNVQFSAVHVGARFTRYEIIPDAGVKVSKIISRKNEIRMALNTTDINIEFPIDGKSTIGIDIANKEILIITLREIIESREFKEFPSNLAFAVWQNISCENVIVDIKQMTHLLISGTTGSGKSVCLDCIIMSILYKAHPNDVKMILIDTKISNLSIYNGIPHLLAPTVTNTNKAIEILNWCISEINDRYIKFSNFGVGNLKDYNAKAGSQEMERLPEILIIIDDWYDLVEYRKDEVEDKIYNLTRFSRNCGIHIIISTNRPSANVITSAIKANIPSRIAFNVSSKVDSMVILDKTGAEKLLGNGDMLLKMIGNGKIIRVQGTFVSDVEISNVVEFLRQQKKTYLYDEIIKEKNPIDFVERDSYFSEAGRFVIEKDKASIGMLQHVYKIGFNRAARIMDQLADVGVVGPEEGTKPRKILMTMEEFEQYLEEYL